MENREWTVRKGKANPKVHSSYGSDVGRGPCTSHLHAHRLGAVLVIKAMVLHFKELRAALASDIPSAVCWSADLSLPQAQ